MLNCSNVIMPARLWQHGDVPPISLIHTINILFHEIMHDHHNRQSLLHQLQVWRVVTPRVQQGCLRCMIRLSCFFQFFFVLFLVFFQFFLVHPFCDLWFFISLWYVTDDDVDREMTGFLYIETPFRPENHGISVFGVFWNSFSDRPGNNGISENKSVGRTVLNNNDTQPQSNFGLFFFLVDLLLTHRP